MAIKELINSRTHTASYQGLTGIRKFFAPWAERKAAGIPALSDPFPGETELVCTSINFNAVPNTKPNANKDGAEFAEVICNYTSIESRKKAVHVEFSTEALDIAEGRTWADTGKPALNQSVTKLFPQMAITVTVYKDTVPWADIRAAQGNVNVSEMEIDGQKYAAGTLLFEGGSSDQEYDEIQNPIFRLVYRFLYKERGHLEVWRPGLQKRDANGKPEWDANDAPIAAPGDDGTGTFAGLVPPLYEDADFSDLF